VERMKRFVEAAPTMRHCQFNATSGQAQITLPASRDQSLTVHVRSGVRHGGAIEGDRRSRLGIVAI